MIASFRWFHPLTTALDVWHQRLWHINENEAVTCPGEQVLVVPAGQLT
jgi:hypothetical protein